MPLKKRYSILLGLLVVLAILWLVFYLLVSVSPPKVSGAKSTLTRETISENNYKLGPNTLRKNEHGVWEMYVEGDAYERGLAIGQLSEELIYYQESAFVKEVIGLLPSKSMMHFLKYVVAWENKDIQAYIPDEFEREIYGISKFCSDDFNYIGPKFHRKLFYHSAHDIGHTVQNMGLVGCSAFSAWGRHTIDGQIITGRNFDFYIGDAFKKNKLILFMKPDKGHAFASYSWPGMIGVLSGMNVEGLTVSLNAGPPEMPQSAKMPVSLLAREILQYASTISEAVAIAKKREVFVSESFVISSAIDGRSIIIEKSPDTTVVVEAVDDLLLCTNHFQSDVFSTMESNLEFKSVSSTQRRLDRMSQLLNNEDSLSVNKSVEILRDMGDDKGKRTGIGNEENLNIMITHHSIVFQPQQATLWITSGDSPMGKYISYSLDNIFGIGGTNEVAIQATETKISGSEWLTSDAYTSYRNYYSTYLEIEKGLEDGGVYTKADFDKLISYNPELYKGYLLAGTYFQEADDCPTAQQYLTQALAKVIPWKRDEQEIQELIRTCE